MKKILLLIFIILFTIASQSDISRPIRYKMPLTLKAPNGGEKWLLGSEKDIEWDHSPIIPTDTIVRLRLIKKEQMIGEIRGDKPLKISDKKFTWKVGHHNGGVAMADEGYIVKILTKDHRYQDASNESFSIIKPIFKKSRMKQ